MSGIPYINLNSQKVRKRFYFTSRRSYISLVLGFAIICVIGFLAFDDRQDRYLPFDRESDRTQHGQSEKSNGFMDSPQEQSLDLDGFYGDDEDSKNTWFSDEEPYAPVNKQKVVTPFKGSGSNTADSASSSPKKNPDDYPFALDDEKDDQDEVNPVTLPSNHPPVVDEKPSLPPNLRFPSNKSEGNEGDGITHGQGNKTTTAIDAVRLKNATALVNSTLLSNSTFVNGTKVLTPINGSKVAGRPSSVTINNSTVSRNASHHLKYQHVVNGTIALAAPPKTVPVTDTKLVNSTDGVSVPVSAPVISVPVDRTNSTPEALQNLTTGVLPSLNQTNVTEAFNLPPSQAPVESLVDSGDLPTLLPPSPPDTPVAAIVKSSKLPTSAKVVPNSLPITNDTTAPVSPDAPLVEESVTASIAANSLFPEPVHDIPETPQTMGTSQRGSSSVHLPEPAVAGPLPNNLPTKSTSIKQVVAAQEAEAHQQLKSLLLEEGEEERR